MSLFSEHSSLIHHLAIASLNLNFPCIHEPLQLLALYLSALRNDLGTIRIAQKCQRRSLEIERKEWKELREYLEERGWSEVMFYATVIFNSPDPDPCVCVAWIVSTYSRIKLPNSLDQSGFYIYYSPFHATLQVIALFSRAHKIVIQRVGLLDGYAETVYQVNISVSIRVERCLYAPVNIIYIR